LFVKRVVDFGTSTLVQRVVHNCTLFVPRISRVNSISTSTCKTTANDCSNDDSDEDSSSDSGRQNWSGEEVGALLYIVAASLVCAYVVVAGCVVTLGNNIRSQARLTCSWNCCGGRVIETVFGEVANFDSVEATLGCVTSINGTIVVIVTG